MTCRKNDKPMIIHQKFKPELWVKTKEPVLVLRTDNEIPKA